MRIDPNVQETGNTINLVPETRAAKKTLNVKTKDGAPLDACACDALYRQPGSQ